VATPRTGTPPDCRPLLADPDDLTLVFQPIVHLAGATVVGYAALARFPGTAGSDVWFAAAAAAGLRAELEALAVHTALARVPELPDTTFLAVDVSASLLGSVPVQEAFGTRARLDRVVVTLTGQAPVEDLGRLRAQTDALRERGALVALAGRGSGHDEAGLQPAAALRPELVVLDRTLVIDADPERLAPAATAGEFAGRLDAWLLVDGLETAAELAASLRLGVPLAQGWLLAPPAPGFRALTPEVVELLRAQTARARTTDSVTSLVRPVRQVCAGEPPGVPTAVVTGQLGEPLALLLADPRTLEVSAAPVTLCVPATAGIVWTLERALRRPPAHRFDPVVCTDRTGAVLGLLRVEDLAAVSRSRRSAAAAAHR
jgi:EAL domain-containing protein (putative c-di-GMP-specific phosphodiesterase class I)